MKHDVFKASIAEERQDHKMKAASLIHNTVDWVYFISVNNKRRNGGKT